MDRLIAVLIAFFLIVPCSAELITVDDSGPADYRTIQEAIDNSQDGDTIVVRPGTYRKQVVFSGRRVTLRSENPDDPVVVEATVIAPDSVYSVLFDFGEGRQSVLEGFTITGHGIFCAGTSPTISKNVIRHCAEAGITGESSAAPTIVGNTIVSSEREGVYGCNGLIEGNTISRNETGIAYCNGPIRDNEITDNVMEGIYVSGGPIERNTIARNIAGIAYGDGLIQGNDISHNGDAGGLYFCDGDIIGNVIVGNVAEFDGGALYSCQGWILDNVIAGNRTDRDGGALRDCNQRICGNTIVGNVAVARGGGLSRCPGTVCNNIIAFNRATFAGGIYGPSQNSYNGFWANAGGNFGGDATVGAGDFVAHPLFAADGSWDDGGTDPIDDDIWTDGDYHLKSQIGRWDPGAGRWVTDDGTSPCIDTGDPGSVWSAELWPHGRRVNLGAYGGTGQA
ncbi:MAG: NosD domain-containing protein, partial [Planctomycetota bacterium]